MKKSVSKNCLLVSSLFLIILLMPFISSAVTPITAKAPLNYKVSFSILNPSEMYALLDSFHTKAGTDGLAQINYSSTLDEIKIGVLVRFAGEKISYDVYGPYTTGETVYIDTETKEVLLGNEATSFLSPQEVLIEEESEELEEPLESESNETEESIFPTGKVVSIIKQNRTIIIYVFLGALVLAGAVFSFIRFKKMKKGSGDIKVKKLSDLKKEKEDFDVEKDEIEKLQIQIAEAQKAINKIKNKEKIKEAEKKLEEDKAELEKLQKGED